MALRLSLLLLLVVCTLSACERSSRPVTGRGTPADAPKYDVNPDTGR